MNKKPSAIVLGRRRFLAKTAALTSAIPLSAAFTAVNAQTPKPAGTKDKPAQELAKLSDPLFGYTSFSQEEATFVEALVDHMCPADDLTPSGVDCGLAIYIDRQLSGDYGKGARRYMLGPWKKATPQHGYQLPLTPEQFFKQGIAAANDLCQKQHKKTFAELGAKDMEAFLQNVAGNKFTDAPLPMATWFNEIVYPLFEQACFADPLYSGNVDKVFWKMIGYPGLPATHTRNIVDYRGKPFPGAKTPSSIVDFS